MLKVLYHKLVSKIGSNVCFKRGNGTAMIFCVELCNSDKTLEIRSWVLVQEEYIDLGGKRQHHHLKPLTQALPSE